MPQGSVRVYVVRLGVAAPPPPTEFADRMGDWYDEHPGDRAFGCDLIVVTLRGESLRAAIVRHAGTAMPKNVTMTAELLAPGDVYNMRRDNLFAAAQFVQRALFRLERKKETTRAASHRKQQRHGRRVPAARALATQPRVADR